MAGEFLSVPGNVKQIFLPFVLDPNNAINTDPISVQKNAPGDSQDATAQVGGQKTQLFTFRTKPESGSLWENGKSIDAGGLIRIAPGSFYNTQGVNPADDISYKLLYGYESDGTIGKTSIDPLTHILDNIPRITIREYLMDAKLDQLMNIFAELGHGWNSGANAGNVANAASDEEKKNAATRSALSKIFDAASNAVDFGTVIINNFDKVVADVFQPVIASLGKEINSIGDTQSFGLSDFVLKIPYILYYKMLSSTSTNIYEIPYSGTVMYESDGHTGWAKKELLSGFEGHGLMALGGLTNFIGKNVKVNTTPTWDGASDSEGIKVETEFTLFNDTVDGALKNFIFVNTIIPGNMWMQYHLYQHAPNLYDIRIEGVKRLYMCAGSFKCEQLGVLRNPPKQFIDDLVSKHCRTSGTKYFNPDNKELLSQIKIPDAYKITCTFTSLLPNNFNNYLYSYYGNEKIGKGKLELSGQDIRTESGWEKVTQSLKEEVGAIWAYPKQAKYWFGTSPAPGDPYLKPLRDKIKNKEFSELEETEKDM